MTDENPYDAVLIVAFGGPEGRDEVIPFLENVLRGKPVPRERMLEVAEHYYPFDGVSPINRQCRNMIAALETELSVNGVSLPVYWGNRNWRPLLPETLATMRADGVRRALAFVTSAYGSYSSCRQYRENIAAAQATVGGDAPQIDKLRTFYNHPDFIAAWTKCVAAAIDEVPAERRSALQLLFTAHSIPQAMADGCDYVQQLDESSRLVAEAVGVDDQRWRLVYQSRSGRPQDPWLEPDIVESLRKLHGRGVRDAVVAPIGFLSDHMEVLFDLDVEARQACEELGLNMIRSRTVGTHPRFIAMVRKLIQERLELTAAEAIGDYGPGHNVCPLHCCPAPVRRPA